MKRFVFDAIITDYDMPGMNGIQLALLARNALMDMPVILYTGNIHLIDRQQMVEAGIAEVVRKPCSSKDLASVIKKVIADKKKYHSLKESKHAYKRMHLVQ